ncbi:LysM peptidoglycan-binding domain-containing protein [Streptomyces sp. NPDC096339]|uniref:LysM peptidoglycan-binding domain-containing protein n=1 Tax=Streptomyces sp. NPDC096339 TaxID=3366086 RepID=UPI003812A51F
MNKRSTTFTIVRALLALVTLAVLVAGVPYALLAVGVLPDHLPSLDEVVTALTSPDSGSLFLGAITLIGWYGWITFVISVVLETGAALRHRSAPRIRLLGGSQQLAGALVGGILILLPTGTAFASTVPATAAPVAAVASVTPNTATSATSVKAGTTYDGPVHHVVRGDSLWDIAEKRLGGGIEWHRIIEVNQGIPQPDGTLITADTTVLQPGWILRLPANATAADTGATGSQQGATAPADAAPAATTTHKVLPGETLSSIAEVELGDDADYPAIVELNEGVRQSDGRTFTDPDDIHPGWQLKLPAPHDGSAAPTADTPAPPPVQQPAPEQDHGGGQPGGGETGSGETGAGQHDGPKGDGDGKGDGGQPTALPQTPSEQPSAQAPAPQQPPAAQQTPAPQQTPENPSTGTPTDQAPVPAPQETSDTGDQTVKTVAAAGSILAAAVLAVIATRRARQQRRRRPKRRIPMPSGAEADFETQLRVASDITGTALADRVLRTLAFNCRAMGRPLPEIEAMRITPRGVELHLAAATPPVAPFAEREGNPGVWWCPVAGASLRSEGEVAELNPPYPALVSLGETEDGDAVLVDLETVGLLRLAGSPADVRGVMLALAVELASSRLAPTTQIVLAGSGSDLQALYPDQIDHHTDLDVAAAELQAHDAFQRAALDDGSHDHLRSARLSEQASGDSWVPRILISTAPLSGQAADVLEDVLASRPRTSVAVVTAAAGELDLHGSWTLPAHPDGLVDLPGLDLSVKLQYLDETAYGRLVTLLSTSSRTDDVPPPPWTGHTGPLDHNGPRGSVAASAPEESALSPETTAGPMAAVAPTPPPAWAPAPAPGGDLATALPDFSFPTPAFTPSTSTEEDTSGLAPDVAGSFAQPPVEAAEEAALASFDATEPFDVMEPFDAMEPFDLDGEDEDADADADADSTVRRDDASGHVLFEEEPEEESASALGAGVWGDPESAEFDDVLNEVLTERADDEDPYAWEDSDSDSDSDGDPDLAEEADSGLSPAALGRSDTPGTEPAERRIAPRPSAATSTVLAALSTPPNVPGTPQVQVLGPVDLVGTLGRVESNRANSLKEIAAWLVLHPGLSRQDLDDAIWPGIRTRSDSRNSAISKLRVWLGRDPLLPASDPHTYYLPHIRNGVYSFNDQVTSDWDQFKELYRQGMHNDGQDADNALAQALALVRGRPFSDVDPSKYIWAEADIQEMISAIVDVAHELAERRRHVRDYRAAAQAVTKGMLVDSQSELLYRDLFTICHELGDHEGLQRAAHQLARINAEEGCDSSPETLGLLRTLLKGERPQPTLGSAVS